jgi:putative heme-binding domain-containing protein
MTAARGLAQFDDPAVARRLIQAYRKFQVSERPALLDALVSRPSFAKELLSNLGPSKIPREDLGAFHARQIRSLQDPVLDKMLVEAWGELRDSPADKKSQMAELRQKLTPSVISRANLSQGRALYQKACASCHMMYGEGQKVGPDLTGSGRGNMDYLLENIIDPGAVVPADYRMSVVALNDGRVLTGLVLAKNKQTLTLREPSETRTIAMADVEVIKVSTASLMPDGLLQTLTPDQVRDLFAYMMHQGQVPLP